MPTLERNCSPAAPPLSIARPSPGNRRLFSPPFLKFQVSSSESRNSGRFGARTFRHCDYCPLTPALSPSVGASDTLSAHPGGRSFPLSPAEGERAGVRG